MVYSSKILSPSVPQNPWNHLVTSRCSYCSVRFSSSSCRLLAVCGTVPLHAATACPTASCAAPIVPGVGTTVLRWPELRRRTDPGGAKRGRPSREEPSNVTDLLRPWPPSYTKKTMEIVQ